MVLHISMGTSGNTRTANGSNLIATLYELTILDENGIIMHVVRKYLVSMIDDPEIPFIIHLFGKYDTTIRN